MDLKKNFRLPIDFNGDKKKLSLLNPNNKLVTADIINGILDLCQVTYRIQNVSLFQLSFTHRSYVIINNPEIEYEHVDGCVPLQLTHNERSEFLGDRVIDMVVAAYLYDRYKKKDEEDLTVLKSKLVKTKMLAKFSSYLGLGQYILMSKHVEDFGHGRQNEKILENTFEAFLCALYKDIQQDNMVNFGQAQQVCCHFLINLIEATTDFRDLLTDENYKQQLLIYVQKNFGGLHPIYQILRADGPTNKRIYTMGVYHPRQAKLLIGQGTAKVKVDAEQLASKEGIEYFRQNPHVPEPEELELKAYQQQDKQLDEELIQLEAKIVYLREQNENDPEILILITQKDTKTSERKQVKSEIIRLKTLFNYV